MGKKRAKDKSPREDEEIDLTGEWTSILLVLGQHATGPRLNFLSHPLVLFTVVIRPKLQAHQERNRPNSPQETDRQLGLDQLPGVQARRQQGEHWHQPGARGGEGDSSRVDVSEVRPQSEFIINLVPLWMFDLLFLPKPPWSSSLPGLRAPLWEPARHQTLWDAAVRPPLPGGQHGQLECVVSVMLGFKQSYFHNVCWI